MAKGSSTGGKNRKIGRNKIKCQRYSAEHRRRKNKIRKLKRHIRGVTRKIAYMERRRDSGKSFRIVNRDMVAEQALDKIG